MSPLLAATETERVSVHADKFQQRLCHTLTARGVGTTDRQLHWGDSGGSEDKPSSWPYLKEEATSLSLMVVSERRQMATRCSWWSRRAEWSQQRQKVFSKGFRAELPEREAFLLLLLFVCFFVCFLFLQQVSASISAVIAEEQQRSTRDKKVIYKNTNRNAQLYPSLQ